VPDSTPIAFSLVNLDDFTVRDLDDEFRVDALCRRLLLSIRHQLLRRGDLTPLQVGRLCHGADLFLRDFVIAACGDNLFRLPAERVRQFAGHWYIVNTLEPNGAELAVLLDGIATCYEVLAGQGLVDRTLSDDVAAACADLPGYRQRIEEFWAITGDGYERWRTACPLPERPA
jgi:hypothetical protein